jgi:hypothetical protein
MAVRRWLALLVDLKRSYPHSVSIMVDKGVECLVGRPPMLRFDRISDFIHNVLVVLFKNRERLFEQFKRSHSSDRATIILF